MKIIKTYVMCVVVFLFVSSSFVFAETLAEKDYPQITEKNGIITIEGVILYKYMSVFNGVVRIFIDGIPNMFFTINGSNVSRETRNQIWSSQKGNFIKLSYKNGGEEYHKGVCVPVSTFEIVSPRIANIPEKYLKYKDGHEKIIAIRTVSPDGKTVTVWGILADILPSDDFNFFRGYIYGMPKLVFGMSRSRDPLLSGIELATPGNEVRITYNLEDERPPLGGATPVISFYAFH